MKRDVRDQARVVEKKWLVLVLFDECEGLVIDVVRRVILPFEQVVAGRIQRISAFCQRGMAGNGGIVLEEEFPIVVPKIGRVVGVGVGLAVVAEELFKTLVVRIPFRPDIAQTPFAEGSADIPLLNKQLSDRHLGVRNRMIALRLHPTVVAHLCVTGVPPCHEDTAGRGTNCVSGVSAGETHSFRSELVDAGRIDLLLPVASQLPKPKVIRKNKNDIRFS